jgi:hypothetical protein
MKFAATQSKEFKQCPAGSHVAICNAVVDMGLQPGSDTYPTPKHQVYIRFEIPGERVSYIKDDQDIEGPMSIGRTFTASMNEKANLRLFLEGMFGKKFPGDETASNFDLKSVLGKKCLLNVTHTSKGGKTYANLAGAMPLPKGMSDDSKQENDSLYFSLDGAQSEMQKVFNKLPKWLQSKIEGRLLNEQHIAPSAPTKADEFNDDIPF